jgi:hypothetical protein
VFPFYFKKLSLFSLASPVEDAFFVRTNLSLELCLFEGELVLLLSSFCIGHVYLLNQLFRLDTIEIIAVLQLF